MGRKLTQQEAEEKVKNSFKENVILVSEYINRRSSVKLKCLDCGQEWETIYQNIGYGNTIHHCLNCWDKQNENKWEEKICAKCGKKILRLKSRINRNKSGLFYCSKDCGNIYKNIVREENGEWKNTKNYRKVAFYNNKHECSVCGWEEDKRILEVHHIDGDRENNSSENLVILCPICHRKITLGYYLLENNKLIEMISE